METFEKKGGVKALLAWANENPTEFYRIWCRMLPNEVTGPNGGPLEHTHWCS